MTQRITNHDLAVALDNLNILSGQASGAYYALEGLTLVRTDVTMTVFEAPSKRALYAFIGAMEQGFRDAAEVYRVPTYGRSYMEHREDVAFASLHDALRTAAREAQRAGCSVYVVFGTNGLSAGWAEMDGACWVNVPNADPELRYRYVDGYMRRPDAVAA